MNDIYYGLMWPGQKEMMKILREQPAARLAACREESVNFDATCNIFIEGDNLKVLKLLRRNYSGKIKMIYIDPPYNTGREFIYADNFTDSVRTYRKHSAMLPEKKNNGSEENHYGVRHHARWLNMMYPRLSLAVDLLRKDGVIFISIGQDELANLILIANAICGEQNRISICTRLMKTGGQKGVFFSPNTDYIVIYAKNIDSLENFRDVLGEETINKVYTQVELNGPRTGERYREMGLYQPLDIRANQRYYIECPDGELVLPPGYSFPAETAEGAKIKPVSGDGVWRWIYARFRDELKKGNVVFKITASSPLITSANKKSRWNIYTKIWLNDRIQKGKVPLDILDKFENRHSARELNKLGIPFDYAKPSSLIAYLAGLCGVNGDDIVLDFFAGSGTTAHAVLDLNRRDHGSRRFILVQLPELCPEKSEAFKKGFTTIAEICKERIRRVIKTISEEQPAYPETDRASKNPPGFKVFKLMPL